MALAAIAVSAQEKTTGESRFDFSLRYDGELQCNFKDGSNFLNLLRLNGSYAFSDNIKLCISTLSIAKSNDYIMDDLQVFSNLEAEDGIPLTFAVAGIEASLPTSSGEHTAFFGIRNTGEDYFASDVTSFFVNSSCGIFPVISANFPIATYPFGAMCLHYSYGSEHWGAKATIYNGEGRYKLTGRENIFRINPKNDGIFCMAQGEYKSKGSSYFLGGSLYKSSPTLWSYCEQQLCKQHNLKAIASFGHSFDEETLCRNFIGIGATMCIGNIETGFFSDYADMGEHHEYATELSVKVPLTSHLSVQPALHYINGTTATGFIGLIRLGVEI